MRYARILGPVFFVLAVAGGALATLAPVAWPGLELLGWACGGGGEEQVCRKLTRHPTLVAVDWKAWLWVAGGAACSAIALSALVIRDELWRLVAAIALFTLAVAGVVTTTKVEVLLGPDDDISTLGRSDERWGPYLRPALLDFRADALRRYEGRRERPGAPPFEREQTLESFAVHALRGWKVLRWTLLVLLFASLFEVARRSVRRPSLALVTALTGGTLIWVATLDMSSVGAEGPPEYQGLATALTILAGAAAWAAYGLGVAAGRLVLPRPRRQRVDGYQADDT
jgi:hypothetical protein